MRVKVNLLMHFNSHFTAVEILWTLTFAALMVLLVVLWGRDRVRRFPIFNISIVLIGLSMLAHKLIGDRMAPMISTTIYLVLADLSVVVVLMLAVELARRIFVGVRSLGWVVGAMLLLAGSTAVVAWWGSWPPAKVIFEHSTLGHLRFMQLIAQKGELFNDALTLELFILAAIAGRRFGAGWRSHALQILTGLSTTSATLIVVRIVWEALSKNAPHTQASYEHMLNLQDKLLNANSTVVVLVMMWWIVCLWIDEPTTTLGRPEQAAPIVDTFEMNGETIARPVDSGTELKTDSTDEA
jgi:hypothetical protein